MRRIGWGMAAVLAVLAGCGAEPTEEERAAEAEREIALVERANNTPPPLREIVPEPITWSDMERHDLSGNACNYAPGTSFGTRVVARESDAHVKIDGDIVRLSADQGARELPAGTKSRYIGREHELNLALDGEGEPSGTAKADYEGTVTLRDEHGRITYQGTGLAQCDI